MGRRIHTAPPGQRCLSACSDLAWFLTHCANASRFLCGSGCCVDEAGWCLALPLQRTLAPFWGPCCVFWGTQHDYSQTDHDRQLAAGSLSCLPPRRPGTLWQGRAEWVPPHQSFPAPALHQCAVKAGAASLSPPLSRDLCSVRHRWPAVPVAHKTEEEASCWRWDPEDHLPPTWPWRESLGEQEPLLAKIHSVPTAGTSHLCQRMPGVPLLSSRDFRARCQPNSSCV